MEYVTGARCGLLWVMFGAASVLANSSFDASIRLAQNNANSGIKSRPAKAESTKKSPVKKNSPRHSKPAKGVVARFTAGMEIFNSGHFEDALVVFATLHKEYPAHEPTTIQYAKTLYRLDRIPESYNLFARISPQYLDPETAYEYGYSFYVQTQFEGALYSFQRVPADHPLYDLASYYGSMCAIRLKKYGLAEELLDKAVVLPDKLARSKTLYQKHVASLRQLQEKTDLERSAIDEKQRMIANTARARVQPAPPSVTPASAGPTKYVHKGFYPTNNVLYEAAGSFARLKSENTNESSDLHGYARRTYTQKSGTFEFRHNPMMNFALKGNKDRQAAIGADLYLGVTSLTTEGKKERFVANEDSKDIVQTLTESQPTATSTTGTMSLQLWGETPISGGFWIGSDAHGGFSYPNFSRGQRYGTRGATGIVGWKNDDPITKKAKLSGTYDVIVDAETMPVTSQAVTVASFSMAYPMGLAGGIGAKYIFYSYKIANLPGPDTSTSGFITVSQDFPLGITIGLKGIAEQQSNYIARNLTTGGSASANGKIMTGQGSLSIAPIPWLTVSATHSRSKSTWAVKQVDRNAEFMAATADYTESSVIKGSINFNF